MAANNNKDIMNINDPLDINELAALNDDISTEFIEQLQNQIAQNANLTDNNKQKTDVTNLFEEVNSENSNAETSEKNKNFVPQIDSSIDDNFIKKYKAKIEKQKNAQFEKDKQEQEPKQKPEVPKEEISQTKADIQKEKENKTSNNSAVDVSSLPAQNTTSIANNEPIESLTNGNITEKPVSNEQLEYNESLDLLDDNVKYSKYVIYIDPENTEFIESLTVKERKNLINRILKEQDSIVITKKRLNTMQAYIKHAIIAILTIAIATPVIYYTINASLEATINNHRRSQTIFKTLYREKGKIQNLKY